MVDGKVYYQDTRWQPGSRVGRIFAGRILVKKYISFDDPFPTWVPASQQFRDSRARYYVTSGGGLRHINYVPPPPDLTPSQLAVFITSNQVDVNGTGWGRWGCLWGTTTTDNNASIPHLGDWCSDGRYVTYTPRPEYKSYGSVGTVEFAYACSKNNLTHSWLTFCPPNWEFVDLLWRLRLPNGEYSVVRGGGA